jgi:polygalacturonase
MSRLSSLLSVATHFYCGANAGVATRVVCDLVKDCGAVADNATNAAPAFARCAGPSRTLPCDTLLVPALSIFRMGSIDLSGSANLTLSLGDGAQLWGSTDPLDYPIEPMLPYMGPAVTQWRALIHGRNVSGLTIEGPSTAIVDGNGWPWWANFSSGTLPGNNTRPKLVELPDCSRVRFSGITYRNAAFWQLHPIFCDDVSFVGVTVLAPRAVGNTDGIDPSSSTNVLIDSCMIDVGDDGISVKSGWHDRHPYPLLPSRNILIQHTTILSRNVAIGSACFGGIINVTVVNCTVGDLQGSSPWAVKIKTHSPQGGVASGITFKDSTFGLIAPNAWQQPHGGMAISVYENYGADGLAEETSLPVGTVRAFLERMVAADASLPPAASTVLANVTFQRVTVAGAKWAGQLAGSTNFHLESFTFEDLVCGHVSDSTPWECSEMSGTVTKGEVEPPLPPTCGL